MPDFYDALENQYDALVGSGALQAFELFEFDEDSSQAPLVEAINYFRETGIDSIDSNAPVNHLSDEERKALYKGGKFRQNLYAMLLFSKIEHGLSNKELFLKHSHKYSKKR